MLACSRLGYRIALRRRIPSDDQNQFGVVEAAILGLLGLLLGFTLQGSMSHLDEKRRLIVQEANAIGTAYLRIDLLDSSDQPELRQLFRSYLEARLRVYDTVDAGENPEQAMAQTLQLQSRIWDRGVQSRSWGGMQIAGALVVTAFNEMIDVTTARIFADRTRLPGLILILLCGASALSSLLIGYGMALQKHRSPIHCAAFCLIISATVYVLLDLDNPRLGLIRLDVAERSLRELHDSIR
jgi:hypothetical protein